MYFNFYYKPIFHLRKSLLYTAQFFSLAGACLAFYATGLTIKLTISGILDPSGCSFNDWISCDTVLSTSSAKLFGAPVAWWGFLFYLWSFFAILFAIIKSNKPSGKASAEAVLFICIISVIFTCFKIYELYTFKVICPVCVGMYISNFAITFFLMQSLKLPFKKFISFFINYFKSIFTRKSTDFDSPHPLRFGVIFIWVFAMGYLGMKYYENTVIKPGKINVQLILTEHFKQQAVTINTDGSPVTGNPEAKVKIVEFSDFECPSCRLLSSNMNAILLEYKDKVSFYFMNYPLDKSINENVKKEIHKNAGITALAGVCANEQGDFWNFQNALFENQTKLGRDFLIELAEQQGLDKDKFISCLDSEETKQKVMQDIKQGNDIGITGTPALFINGRKVKYWNSLDVVKEIIDEEMKR